MPQATFSAIKAATPIYGFLVGGLLYKHNIRRAIRSIKLVEGAVSRPTTAPKIAFMAAIMVATAYNLKNPNTV